MNKKDLVMLIMARRTLDYQKDPDPENWRTIKGAHVHVDNEGKIDGGAGGKFNGKGALPRSLFPGQGKAKQTEFAEVTAKRKETEEAAKKAAAEAKERHKKELAEAKKAKREKERELEKKRPELKQKFNDLRESYHKETDVKKKKAIIKQLKEIESEYKDKFGKHPDDDNIKLPEKKPEAKKETKNYYGIPYGSNGVSEQLAYELHSRRKPNSSFEEETAFSVQDLIKELNNGLSLEEAVKKVDKQWQPDYPESRTPIYYFMKSFNERNGKKEAAKEPKKPAVKNSAAESLIDYVKQQTNIDLSKHRDTEREKRGQLLINWKELDRNQKSAIQTLAQKGKFELIDNGGYGYILKPTKEPKMGAPKTPKKKTDPASSEAQAKRKAIVDDVMKNSFVSNKVNEASKKLIDKANKDYGGDHETSVMLENVVKEKDGKYVTLKIVAKDKTGKSKFPQTKSITFKV